MSNVTLSDFKLYRWRPIPFRLGNGIPQLAQLRLVAGGGSLLCTISSFPGAPAIEFRNSLCRIRRRFEHVDRVLQVPYRFLIGDASLGSASDMRHMLSIVMYRLKI